MTPSQAMTAPLHRSLARISLLVLSACSGADKSSSREAAQPAAPDTGMASMPGMKGTATSTVSFSALQIEHGKVRWAPAGSATRASATIVPGVVAANDDRTARLGAPARARIVAVHVRPGDHVEAGQLLVTLQSADAAMSQSDVLKGTAEVTSRRAQASYAKAAHERAERLLALKAIPRQEVERSAADDELARAALSQAEAELQRARSTAEQLGASRSSTGEIAHVAPLAGVILARTAVAGAVVEAGTPLVVVTDPSTLWLTVSAPEQHAALFHVGGALQFTVPAYPTETFSARVDAVGAGLDPDTRTLSVRGRIVNTAGRLRPEMLASVTVFGRGNAGTIVLPDSAVQLLNDRTTVFVAVPDGKGGAHFTARDVEVGARAGGLIAVLRGLSVGDIVVVGGAFAVKAAFLKSTMPKMEM